MDKRLFPFNGRVAHSALRGEVEAEVFTQGTRHTIQTETADLLDAPEGQRQCQLLFGEAIQILEVQDEQAFGIAERDGYVGWVKPHEIKAQAPDPQDHIVIIPQAMVLDRPDVTKAQKHTLFSLGSRVTIAPNQQNTASGWSALALPQGTGYIRSHQIAPQSWQADDPAQIAQSLLHSPYLWGGDSAKGIDCSGLVQRALTSAGLPCPRDSDMQARAFAAIEKADLRRGDLVFWKGHVGMMLDAKTLIHANAHHMAVATEPLDQAIARIAKKEFGAVTGFARPAP